MFIELPICVLLGLAATANSVAVPSFKRRSTDGQTSIPQNDSNNTARAQGILGKRAGYLYGPSPLGAAPFFPTGPLGIARVEADIAAFTVDSDYISGEIGADILLVEQAIGANGGLKSLDDYANILYNNEWKTSIPSGEDLGMLTNYTQDLLFSMERLTLNPYPLHRVQKKGDLPFTIDDATSKSISGQTLQSLQQSGRLFIVDHSYQSQYPKVTNKYGAACTAYFYIHPQSGDFLPLAIKTNTDKDLIYTPLDSANDWLLAKMMFNVNDIFHAEMYHLTASHVVAEIVHLAALRTLSDNHPIMALLDRLMVEAYAIRPVGAQILFNPGGSFDNAFQITGSGAIQFANTIYPLTGRYKSNYLTTLLTTQGLLHSSFGPQLKFFPFLSDTQSLLHIIQTFLTKFIDSYYPSPSLILSDPELLAWFTEASSTGSAAVLDFPTYSELQQDPKKVLIEVLSHFWYLVSILHPALNTGSLVTQNPLPFHPLALYSPLPTSKDITTAQLLSYLPTVPDALFEIDLLAVFNRPQFEGQGKTLKDVFTDPNFQGRFNGVVGEAMGHFGVEMRGFSEGVRGRVFAGDGLWEGCPFVWKALDPGSTPWFMAV